MGHEVHVMTYEGTKVEGAVTHTMKAREKYRFDFLFKLHTWFKVYKECSFALLGLLIKRIKKCKIGA